MLKGEVASLKAELANKAKVIKQLARETSQLKQHALSKQRKITLTTRTKRKFQKRLSYEKASKARHESQHNTELGDVKAQI